MNSPSRKDQEEGCSVKGVVDIYTEREQLMITLFILLALIILAVAAFYRGANSSDGVNSTEWRRRQQWYGFH